MTETEIRIHSSSGISLQARMSRGPRAGTAVICHPHPLYGGNMDNNVVLAVRDAFAGLGLGTIRFNMRGVGQSTGSFDNGRGEAGDLAAVLEHARSLDPAPEEIHLAAYSFGAWVSLRAVAEGLRPWTCTLVSPPLDLMNFEGLSLPPCPTLVITGDHDDFCSKASLERFCGLDPSTGRRNDANMVVLEDTDHFYLGREGALAAAISKLIDRA